MAEPEDPCVRAARLKEIRTAIATGDTVSKAKFGDEEVAYFQANIEMLDREIADAEKACALQSGTKPKRRRYAASGYMRPY